MRADGRAIPRAALGLVQRRGGASVPPRPRKKSRSTPSTTRVAHAAGAEGDDRRAEGHRLERRDAEVFDAGKDQALRAAEVIDDHVSRYVAEELNVGAAARREACRAAARRR